MVCNSFNQFILGIEENSPLGKDWSTVDAEPMKHVSYKKKIISDEKKCFLNFPCCSYLAVTVLLTLQFFSSWKNLSHARKNIFLQM